MKSKPNKPSDFPRFAFFVHQASASVMDFEHYFDLYREELQMLFWNADVDLPIAVAAAEKEMEKNNGKH